MSNVPDWVTLSGSERVVWTGYPSLHLLTGTFLLAVVVVAGGVAALALLAPPLNLVGAALVAGGGLFAAVAYVDHRSTQYVITTEEVYRKTGLLSRHVENLRLDRVQNTSFSQSFLQRLLSYGDVRVDTAGGGDTEIVLAGVPDPQRVNGILTEQLDSRGRTGAS